MKLSKFLSSQLGRAGSFLGSLKLPSIYLVFPGRKGGQDRNKKGAAAPRIKIKRPPALILDTSAVIDGRIADICETGFLEGTLVVTSGVLQELQAIADSKNDLKRNRGRRGLSVLENLQKSRVLPFQNVNLRVSDLNDLDESLVRLAKKIKGKLVTVDYNLNKVGKVRGLKVLNVNELVNAIKTVVLPGESLSVKLVQPGKEKDQAVGYLPDGTMVVVEQGAPLIGRQVTVLVERLLQTEAGRMIFAKSKDQKDLSS